MRARQLHPIQFFSFGASTKDETGKSYSDFAKSRSKFGKDRDENSYAKDIKDRAELKLNWGVKNRWE